MSERSQKAERLDAALAETVLDDELVYDGKLLKAHRRRVTLPDGRTSAREMIAHPGAAAIVVLEDGGVTVLERQWRSPMDRAFWEIPAGKIDKGEDPFETAVRELSEETGLAANRWVELGTIHNAIGYSNERIVIFLAQDVHEAEGGQKLDAGEFLTLERLSFDEALVMTRNGEITDVKTLAGLMWAQAYLAGSLPQAVVRR